MTPVTQPSESGAHYVFLVRHGESRWNRAQGDCNVCGMLGETDHGLSDEGREQSDQLRMRLAEARIRLKTGKVLMWERPWLERFLSPDAIVASPFTRAMQTALIALDDIIEKHGKLKVSPVVREVKTSMGSMDSTGSLTGQDLLQRLREELERLGADDCDAWKSWVESALKRVDLSDVGEKWWSDSADSQSEIVERLETWFDSILAGNAGSSTIVVGHSTFFRNLFKHFAADSVQLDIAESVKAHNVPNCSLIGLRVENLDNERRVTEICPLLDTQLKPADIVPTSLFPLPPSRCCLPQSPYDNEAETEGAPPPSIGDGVRRSQPRVCVLAACNGSRLFG